jgi:nitronate monooxygenase
MGCVGVQMGTRFLATHESGANEHYKKALVEATEQDIELASKPGSPCGMLFRVLKQSPFYQEALKRERAPKCDKGYLLNKGNCPSKYENEKTFCICNGLLASIDLNTNEKELYTVGSKAYMIDRIMSVKELMAELQGEKVDASLFPTVTDVRPQDSSPLIKAGFNFNMQSLTSSLNPQLA